MNSAFKNVSAKKKIANLLFPRYSLALDQANNNAALKAWIKRLPASAPVLDGRPEFENYLFEKHVGTGPINYVEFGVHTGGSITRWSQRNKHPESRFYGFDSFEGLPEDWTPTVKKDYFDLGGKIPVIDDARVTLIKGWFQNTLPEFLKDFRADKPLVIHNDSDLYSSTLFALTSMDQFIKPGSLIIFDDFNSALHEFRAWNDYCRAFMRDGSPVALTAQYAEQIAFVMEK
jgi:O-methyltransferase